MFRHGPEVVDGGVRFHAWAPRLERLAVRVEGRDHAMRRGSQGAWSVEVAGAGHGTRYRLVPPGGEPRPDPASPWQPDGVHGDSCVFDVRRHAWRAPFAGLPPEELVFYELHLGTFTEAGTLDAAAERLPDLVELGVTCVELMPVQPFPGERNWGYDGVYPWAVHEAYGGPSGLQRFVDRAHGLGLAVCLDVVYNHLGPEGNYSGVYAPYFTPRHHSPWGDGLDLDGPGAEPVRSFMTGAALRWVRDFRVDALRLDASHAITDEGPRHLVAEIAEEVRSEAARASRLVQVVAEDERNERRVLDPPPEGWGCTAVWADDLHHALHALLTGERARYYADYGRPGDVVRALAHGFAYRGEHSRYRDRPHGTPVEGLAPWRFVVCDQNHDQVGNRPLGERLAALVPWEALAPVSTLVLLGSGTPLLFMGEEYGEERPFLYFTSHGDPALARAVTEGRRREQVGEAGGKEIPDPQAPETFRRSKLTHRRDGRHRVLREHYRRCLDLRRRHLPELAAGWPVVDRDGSAFTLRRRGLTVRVNLSAGARGGLPAWGVAIEEGG
jgi:maltooligosyltrehalose trehalohydrolase